MQYRVQLYCIAIVLVATTRESIQSQNLLPNPGFEDYLECPLFSEGLQLISQWQTNQLGSGNSSTDWRGRDFIHSCDADVEPWWNDQLGEGVLGNPFLSPRFSDGFEITEVRFSVFNRWGQLVYQSHSVSESGWDGTIGGLLADQDTYIWHLEFGHEENGETILQSASGSVTLLR